MVVARRGWDVVRRERRGSGYSLEFILVGGEPGIELLYLGEGCKSDCKTSISIIFYTRAVAKWHAMGDDGAFWKKNWGES